MARFRIIRSVWQSPHLVFEIEAHSGVVVAGESFSVWDTHHRFDFSVADVQQQGSTTRLFCTSDLLRQRSPDEALPGIMFAGNAGRQFQFRFADRAGWSRVLEF
jgi:hypothetical protein